MIAELGLAIDSEPVARARDEFGRFVAGAGAAQKAADGIASASDRMGDAMRKAAQATTQVQERIGRMVGGFDKVGKSARDSAAAFEEVARQKAGIDQLRASLDPLYAASMRYEQAVEQIEAAVRSGAITQQQANVVTQRAERAYLSVGRRALPEMGRAAGRAGTQLQNASFQIADFAVQVGAGTSASRAMAQQLPQLLGGFGVLGAVMGAAVAVGAGVAPMLLNIGNEAKSTADLIDELAEAMDRLDSASKNSAQSMFNLVQRYGTGAGAVRELLEVERQLAYLDAEDALQATNQALSEMFDQFGNISRVKDVSGVSNFDRAVQELTKNLGLGEAEARLFLTQIEGLNDAEAPREIAAAFRNAWEQLKASALASGEMNAETREVVRQLVEGEKAALALAAVDIASGIGDGADEAARLAQNLFSAATAKAAFADQTARTAAPENQLGFGLGGVADPSVGNAELGFGGTSGPRGYVAPAPASRRFEYNADGTLKLSGGRSGGGGASEAQREHNERLREAERIIADVRTETERYNDELGDLNELHQLGYLDTEAYTRAVAVLNEEFANSQHEQLRQGIESISDSIADAILDSENLGEAFRNMLDQMARDILSSGIQSLLTEMLTPKTGGGGGGFFADIIGSIFGSRNAKGNIFDAGRVVPFASGGIVDSPTLFPMKNGTGLMGEAGPEAVMPLKRGTDGKLGVAAPDGGRTVNITVDVTGARGNAEIEEMVHQGVAGALGEYDRHLPERVAGIGRDERVRR